jgi:hypothetical protein
MLKFEEVDDATRSRPLHFTLAVPTTAHIYNIVRHEYNTLYIHRYIFQTYVHASVSVYIGTYVYSAS